MIRHVFHANLFMFAFLWCLTVTDLNVAISAQHTSQHSSSFYRCFCSLFLLFFLQAQFLSSHAKGTA